MKNFLIKTMLTASVAAGLFTACKKDEAQIVYKGGTTPLLTSSIASGDTLPLLPADSLNTAVAFSWTNPNYQFSNGISSLDVTYYLQIDTVGANFSSKYMQTVAINAALDTAFTVTQFNAIIGNGLQVSFGQTHNIQVRVQAFLGPLNSPTLSNSTIMNSNVYNYLVTPFAPPPKITPPAQLFIIGDATPESPAWDNSANLASQQFKQVSSTDFQITVALTSGKSYLFIPVDNGNWDHKYGGTSASGGAILVDGAVPSANTPAPSSSGTYDIDVNFQTGIYTVTPH